MRRETQDRKYRKALAQTYDPRVSYEQYYNKRNIFKGKTVTAQHSVGVGGTALGNPPTHL